MSLLDQILNLDPPTRVRPEAVHTVAAIIAHETRGFHLPDDELRLRLAEYERRDPRSFFNPTLIELALVSKKRPPKPTPSVPLPNRRPSKFRWRTRKPRLSA